MAGLLVVMLRQEGGLIAKRMGNGAVLVEDMLCTEERNAAPGYYLLLGASKHFQVETSRTGWTLPGGM